MFILNRYIYIYIYIYSTERAQQHSVKDKVEGQWAIFLAGILDGARLLFIGREPVGGHTSTVCVACVHDARHYGNIPSHRASLPLCRYQTILLGDRHTCVSMTRPGSLLYSMMAESQTCNPLITSPCALTTMPPNQCQRQNTSLKSIDKCSALV